MSWFFFVNNSSFIFLSTLNGYNEVIFWKILSMLNDVQYNIFIFLIILAFHFNKKLSFFSNIFVYLIYLFFLKHEGITMYSFLNNYWIVNTTLTNGLCLIHPLCVYFVYMYIIKSVSQQFNIFYYINYVKFINKLIVLNLVSLLLGSWWAQQELNWGGWWNWDFVELILLIFLIKNIIIIHILSLNNSYIIKTNSITLILYLVIFFIFVRWDILNSVHSFNTLNFLERYVNYIVFLLSVVLSIYLFNVYKRYLWYKTNIIFNQSFGKLELINLYLNFFILIVLIFFIYNIYLTTSNETDFLELTKYLKFVLYISFLFSSILFFNKKKLVLTLPPIFTVFFIYNHFILILSFLCIIYKFKWSNKLKIPHSIIILITIVISLSTPVFDYFFSFNGSDFFATNTNVSINNFRLHFESGIVSSNINSNQLDKSTVFISFFENFVNTNDFKLFNVIPFFFINSNVLFAQQYSSLNQSLFIMNNTNIFLIFSLVIILIGFLGFWNKIKLIY